MFFHAHSSASGAPGSKKGTGGSGLHAAGTAAVRTLLLPATAIDRALAVASRAFRAHTESPPFWVLIGVSMAPKARWLSEQSRASSGRDSWNNISMAFCYGHGHLSITPMAREWPGRGCPLREGARIGLCCGGAVCAAQNPGTEKVMEHQEVPATLATSRFRFRSMWPALVP